MSTRPGVRTRQSSVAELVGRAGAGDRGAVARLITWIERDGAEAAQVAELVGAGGDAHVVGVTGAPGAGKSSLVGRSLTLLAARGRAPAVLAVDPSSPLTGGAILGDRVRMDDLPEHAYVRSMATRGRRGGLAAAVPAALRLLAYAGFDPLIVETAGVGQVEVDIAAAADTTVLVSAPGWGDAVQANKAGMLEVADVLVVNKADRPGARAARRDLELMLALGDLSGAQERCGYRPSIVMATATSGEGVAEMWDAVEAHRDHLLATGQLEQRRAARLRAEVASRVEALLAARTSALLDSSAGAEILAGVAAGALSPDAAARLAVERSATRP